MLCLFEDSDKDIKSQFYNSAYSEDVRKDFIYIGSNKNYTLVEEVLKSTEEACALFLDMVPGNKNIIDSYNEFRRMSIDFNFQLIVFPIVCTEFYLIKHLVREGKLSATDEDISIAVNKLVYSNSSLVQDERSRKFCTSFERYCKLVMIKKPADCIKLTGKFGENPCYGYYYEKDCLCSCSEDFCHEISVKDKAVLFVKEFPVFHKGISGTQVVNKETLWQCHRQLVQEYNDMNNYFKKNEADPKKIYRNVKPIK